MPAIAKRRYYKAMDICRDSRRTKQIEKEYTILRTEEAFAGERLDVLA